MENLSDKKEIENGIPQGSVLSVILFLSTINATHDNIDHQLLQGNRQMLLLFSANAHMFNQVK